MDTNRLREYQQPWQHHAYHGLTCWHPYYYHRPPEHFFPLRLQTIYEIADAGGLAPNREACRFGERVSFANPFTTGQVWATQTEAGDTWFTPTLAKFDVETYFLDAYEAGPVDIQAEFGAVHAIVEYSTWEHTGSSRAVLLALLRLAYQKKNSVVEANSEYLSKMIGMPARTIRDAITLLESLKFICQST